MKNYIVYIHQNKINQKRYIGITCQPVQGRWGHKGNRYTKDRQEVFYNAIQKYGWDNFEHLIVYENLSLEEAQEKERELIKKYHTFIYDPDCQGYNMTRGGEGNVKLDYEAIWQAWEEGKSITEIADLIGCSRSGVARALANNPYYSSQESYKRMGENNRNRNGLLINQYDLNGNFLQTFPSLREAARQVNGSEGNISIACQLDSKMAYGYLWRYEGQEQPKPYNRKIYNAVIVEQYDLNNNLINTYNSFTEAGKQTGFNRKSISKAAKSNIEYKNFIWRIKEGG